MTTAAALVFTLSLLVNDVTLWSARNENILKDENKASTLVYLFSISLVISKIDFLPFFLYQKCPIIYHLLEVIITISLIEFSLHYLWRGVQDLVHLHADDILVMLTDNYHLNWLVCYLCCGNTGCTENFIALLLKAISFYTLFSGYFG
ncbi:uncharacterized protein LOC106137983 [Amyelois transitella]|uniref:uncharacterized protein LOC106137983 n=1 Tax=Amyelois transitella TaxID=680683 RepID=UPI0029905CF6|nr:uncharacterized protein LOC106137983 [Amyelois transitella]